VVKPRINPIGGKMKIRRNTFLLALLLLPILTVIAHAQNVIPNVSVSVGQSKNPGDLVPTLQILLLMTVLSLAPSILVMMTSFTRIMIVFHFLRQSLATQNVPSNQILVGLAIFMTFFIMRPVIDQINDTALQPYLKKEISQSKALENAAKPIRAFMLKQTKEDDILLFVDMRKDRPRPKTVDDIPLTTLIPAFIVSELKLAFEIGFLLYLPMLLIDLVVGSVLLSMGMMMLPPVMISLPFKLLLFVLVDGWRLVVESLVKGF